MRREVRAGLGQVENLDQIDELLSQIDPNQNSSEAVTSGPRGRTSGKRSVALPHGWLASRYVDPDEAELLPEAELATSGG